MPQEPRSGSWGVRAGGPQVSRPAGPARMGPAAARPGAPGAHRRAWSGSRVDWRPYAPDDQLLALYRGAGRWCTPPFTRASGSPRWRRWPHGTPVVAAGVSSIRRSSAMPACWWIRSTPRPSRRLSRILTDDGPARTSASAGSSARALLVGGDGGAVQRAWREPLPPDDRLVGAHRAGLLRHQRPVAESRLRMSTVTQPRSRLAEIMKRALITGITGQDGSYLSSSC